MVTAHPDDVDFAAAGSVAVWTNAGVEVVYCIATDGDAGGSDPSVSGPTWLSCAARSSERLPPSWACPR